MKSDIANDDKVEPLFPMWFLVLIFLLMWGFFKSLEPKSRPSHDDYVARFPNLKIYTIHGDDYLQGIPGHQVRFGRKYGAYNRISFYKGDVQTEANSIYHDLDWYHIDTSITTEYPQAGITIHGPTDHEREFGDVKLPMGWGNITIHVIDNVACDDEKEAKGLLVYTVDDLSSKVTK